MFPKKIFKSIIVFFFSLLILIPFLSLDSMGIKPLSGGSESFAYGWVYAIRWLNNEYAFQPHSQPLFVIYSVIYKLFSINEYKGWELFEKWRVINYYWTILLSFISIFLIYYHKKNNLFEIIVFYFLYYFLITLQLGDDTLNSMSYHSISIPVALASLIIYQKLLKDKNYAKKSSFFYLSFYTAICALFKPTFIAFAAPLYALILSDGKYFELKKNFLNSSRTLIFSLIIYLSFLLLFYKFNFTNFFSHFYDTAYFMYSQKDWYDHEKGNNIFFWIYNFVYKRMGLLPFLIYIMIFVNIFFNEKIVTKKKKLFLFCTCLFSPLFFLYHRSYTLAFPEFYAALLSMSIFTFNGSIIKHKIEYSLRKINILYQSIFLIFFTIILLIMAINSKMAHGFNYQKNMVRTDKVLKNFDLKNNERIIFLSGYPEVFLGSIDALCRGTHNVFGGKRSMLYDDKWENVCFHLNETREEINLDLYKKIILIGTKYDEALNKAKQNFPKTMEKSENCKVYKFDRKADFMGGDEMIIECDRK